jgi:hypothetical protein
MDLYIDIEFRGGLMLVTAHGTMAFDAASRLLKHVYETAAQHQMGKVLVNTLAVVGELAVFERYGLGVEAASYLLQHQMNLKLAFVGDPPTQDGFGVRVAQNRGVVAKAFSTPQEALEWLDEMPVVPC